MDLQLVILIGAALTVMLLVYSSAQLMMSGRERRVKQRLTKDDETHVGGVARQGQAMSSLLTRMSAAASKPLQPRSEEQQSDLRRRLGYTGRYSPNAPRVLLGAKVLLFITGGLVGYALMALMELKYPRGLSVPAALAALGLMAPEIWLSMAIKKEQTAIEHALPDALDLLVVCVESGLTMDSALQRVSKELALAHPSLARELAITHIETQMGVPRSEAMRKLAERTGSQALKSLTAMLVQADRFGTSIAGALRVYSESLRVKRQFAAQELAAKASVKLTFPLVFCIFPSLLTVAGGPALVNLLKMMNRH
jgi:tight adherence protein C